MKPGVLVVGWGDVAKRYYAAPLRARFGPDLVGCTVAELEAVASHHGGQFASWGSPELEHRIASGQFDRILILTPPGLHIPQAIRCLELLQRSPVPCTLYVEKPLAFTAADARAGVQNIVALQQSARKSQEVRCIDHYTQKWSTRALHERWPAWVSETGEPSECVFISCEKRPMWESDSFVHGYAREHAVHAWAMLDECCPPFSAAAVDVAAATRQKAWRRRGTPLSCPRETAFIAEGNLRFGEKEGGALRNPVRLTIAAGKGVGIEAKALYIEGSKGRILALFNDDVVLTAASGSQSLCNKTEAPPGEESAYNRILNAILWGRGDGFSVTRDIRAACRDVERTESLALCLGQPTEYEPGETPGPMSELYVRSVARFADRGGPG